METLFPWPQGQVNPAKIQAELRFQGPRELTFHFEVKCPLYLPRPFPGPQVPSQLPRSWKLWEGDVVEFFLQGRETPEDLSRPYLECQISPFSQVLSLVILKPRQHFYTPAPFPFQVSVRKSAEGFQGNFQVKLPEEIRGPLYYGLITASIQIAGETRHFGSEDYVKKTLKEKLDFHRPSLYVPMKHLKERA